MSPMNFHSQCKIPCVFSQTAVKTIPGLFIGCSLLDSLLLSTLECFYDRSCIQMLLDWRNFYTSILLEPVNPIVTQTVPLNSTLSKHFFPNSTFENILSEMFIEEWVSSTDFNHYFHHCQPAHCIYTFTQKYRNLAVITTLLGLMGGLSLVFRFIAPVGIGFIHSIIIRFWCKFPLSKDSFSCLYSF